MLVSVSLDEIPVVIPAQSPKEMISVSEENGKTKVRVNSSSLGTLQECMRKAKYSLNEGWKAEMESPATLFGSAIHKALEVFYNGDPRQRKLPPLETMELLSYGHQAPDPDDLLMRATRAFVEKAQPLVALPAENKRSIQNGVYILWHYFKAYLDDPYVAYIDKQGPFTERQFTFRLFEDANLVIDYFGTIDLVVQHTQTKELLVCDHKTSSVVGVDFYNRLSPNHQYTGYLMGAQRAFGIQTNSFLVNCVQVKEKPKTSRGTPPSFPRQVTTRDADSFEEFEESVIYAVRAYLCAIETGFWPLGHVNACATYGGCQYLSICGAPPSLRGTVLKSKFIQTKREENATE